VTGASPASRSSPVARDADELRYPATLFVWVRWFILVACVVLLIYRPEFTLFTYVAYILCLLLLAALNGYVHYRVRWGRTVTLHWMLALSATDVALITAGMVVAGGFSHFLFYLLYYPALAWFAVFFSSFRLTFAWVTMVAVIYTVVSLAVGEGLDLEAKDDKALFARIAVMYAVVASVNLVSSSERMKRREAVERERALQGERIELSRTIHDTVAQSVYVVGLGIETARDLARGTSDELMERLDAAYALSRTALWELRHPIDSGQIFEGLDLEEALNSHAFSFTAITGVPVEVVRTGAEPDLPPLIRGLLFGITHNAMTNVLLHAQASRVEVALDFQDDHLCLSVSDDGIGLPQDYEVRGHGFRNMRADAERMGGGLEVQSSEIDGGTTVSCVIPCPSVRRE
jgi:two-component system sensor histidine kinase DesK